MPAVRFPYAVRQAARLTALLGGCFMQPLAAATWREPVEVVYDTAGSPLTAAEVDAAIDYVLAAWNARIELPLRRSDARPGPSYQKGRIVIRWIDSLEQIRSGASLLGIASTRRWTRSSTQTIAGAEINLHSTPIRSRGGGACFTHVLLHEVGHALGIGHIADTNAVMHEGLGSCHHTLTAADIAAAPYPQHGCHAELLPDFDIYIPVLTAGPRTFAGRLHYAEGTWTVLDYREVPYRSGCRDTRLEDGNLILEGLWSPARTWQAKLAPTAAGTWKLVFAM